ncbi:MAG: ABC transporter permease [Pseudomonadota bacterium]
MIRSLGIGLGALTIALVFWQGLIWIFGFQKFILPQPHEVVVSLWEFRALIAENALVTVQAVVLGLILGAGLGAATAISLAASPFARTYLRPILVFTQAIPVFALAPILMIWFGFGTAPKIAMALLIIYFPVTSAFFDGLTNTPRGYLDLAQTMQARPFQTLWRVRVPAAIPSLCSGLRLAAVYAPIGAVIADWVGGRAEGLGYLMIYANSRTKIDLMFAALVVLAVLTVLLHAGVDRFCRWLTARYT